MILSFEGGSSRSHYVEESFWRRLWTCRQTEYWMNEWMNEFVALWIPHTMRMRRIICSLRRYKMFFPHYLINGTIFGKYLLHIKWVFWFPVQRLYETFVILKKYGSRYDKKCILVVMGSIRYSCQIFMKLDLSRKSFGKITKYEILWKYVHPVGVELFHAGWWTDMKLIVAFGNFANAPKCILVVIGSIRYSCQIFMNLDLSRMIFGKITKYEILWKSVHPVGVELFHAGWWTDMTKLMVAFDKFCERT